MLVIWELMKFETVIKHSCEFKNCLVCQSHWSMVAVVLFISSTDDHRCQLCVWFAVSTGSNMATEWNRSHPVLHWPRRVAMGWRNVTIITSWWLLANCEMRICIYMYSSQIRRITYYSNSEFALATKFIWLQISRFGFCYAKLNLGSTLNLVIWFQNNVSKKFR